MATKYVCDGCGCERSSPTLNKVSIEIRDEYGSERNPDYDLCNSCLEKLERSFPNHWSHESKK